MIGWGIRPLFDCYAVDRRIKCDSLPFSWSISVIVWSVGNGPVSTKLTGRYLVRAYRPALKEVKNSYKKVADRMELRRHALKLRYWPDPTADVRSGHLLDLNWDWIEGVSSRDVGELRIDDVIAGNNNLRIIFYIGEKLDGFSMPIIWVLTVFQKKRMYFSTYDLDVFHERRRQIRKRFYRL